MAAELWRNCGKHIGILALPPCGSAGSTHAAKQ